MHVLHVTFIVGLARGPPAKFTGVCAQTRLGAGRTRGGARDVYWTRGHGTATEIDTSANECRRHSFIDFDRTKLKSSSGKLKRLACIHGVEGSQRAKYSVEGIPTYVYRITTSHVAHASRRIVHGSSSKYGASYPGRLPFELNEQVLVSIPGSLSCPLLPPSLSYHLRSPVTSSTAPNPTWLMPLREPVAQSCDCLTSRLGSPQDLLQQGTSARVF
ncbi:hypothetical protein C8Q78DRAFT_676356 [Trametes maxima]|nr:hypothetical protein C8Q78DRAFT_676356 [Trametes maxima]